MNKFVPVALVATLIAAGLPTAAIHAQPAPQTSVAAASVVAREGQVLYDGKGKRVITVNRVATDGSVKVIFDGRLVTVPAATLSLVNGKLTTSLTKAEIAKLR